MPDSPFESVRAIAKSNVKNVPTWHARGGRPPCLGRGPVGGPCPTGRRARDGGRCTTCADWVRTRLRKLERMAIEKNLPVPQEEVTALRSANPKVAR